MIKKGIFYTSILLIVAFISSGFKPYNSQINSGFRVDENEELLYVFPSQNIIDYVTLRVPYTGRYFIGYKEAIAHKESQGKYKKINTLGYLGKYQFGVETLKSIGIHDSVGFAPHSYFRAKIALPIHCSTRPLAMPRIAASPARLRGRWHHQLIGLTLAQMPGWQIC